MSEQANDVGNVDNAAGSEVVSEQDKPILHSTYQKLMDQHKNAQRELNELKEQNRLTEEAGLLEQNKYKELYESRTSDYDKLKGDFEGLRGSIVRAEKLSAFEKAAGAELAHDDFAKHVNLDGIHIMDSGEFDKHSLESVVGEFKNTYGDTLFNINKGKALPSEAAKTTPVKGLTDLTTEEIKAKLKELT